MSPMIARIPIIPESQTLELWKGRIYREDAPLYIASILLAGRVKAWLNARGVKIFYGMEVSRYRHMDITVVHILLGLAENANWRNGLSAEAKWTYPGGGIKCLVGFPAWIRDPRMDDIQLRDGEYLKRLAKEVQDEVSGVAPTHVACNTTDIIL